jgi:DNA-binding NtrC family response regulator
MESELFGYVRGAFTGATQNRLGRLEQANGGTLFLDEVGDLDLPLQAKLLRVLQEREFSPVGSDTVRRVDVRFIAATHRDLKAMVGEQRFREDLLYRLDVYRIEVPPLRARREDIPLLATAFLERLRAEMDRPVLGFTDAAMDALKRHGWPGNVRELRNAIERSLLSCKGPRIDVQDLRHSVTAATPPEGSEASLLDAATAHGLDAWLDDLERRAIVEALSQSEGVQVQAARRLRISERSLWHRVKKLGIRIQRTVGD